jgi:hypothetical protein
MSEAGSWDRLGMAKEPVECEHPQGSAVGEYRCWNDGHGEMHFEIGPSDEAKYRRLLQILFTPQPRSE